MTETNVDAILEIRLKKCTNMLQLQIVKFIQSTFEDALRASYFKAYNGLTCVMFNAFEQAFGSWPIQLDPCSIQGWDAQPCPGKLCSRYNFSVSTVQRRNGLPSRQDCWRDGGQSLP